MTDTILELKGINKRFPGVLALDNASLNVKKGEVHILLGENGAGKSTLVKILSGAYTKDSGEIIYKDKKTEILSPKHAQSLGINIIYQEFNLVPYLTVAENIFLGREPLKKGTKAIDWSKLFNDTKELLESLNIDINPKKYVKNLGIAQQQMVEVAKALSTNSDIIIMDEPTAVLTEREIKELFKIIHRIRNKGVSIIYISHRMEEFEHIGNRITVMRDGKTIDTVNIDEIDIDGLIKLMVGRSLEDKFPKEEFPITDEVFSVKNLTREGVINNINFSIKKGEILGIAGLVGSGRTEIARAIFGLDEKDSGEIFIHNKKANIKHPKDAINAGIGFVTEDRKGEGLVLSMNVKENISLASLKEFCNPSINHLKEINIAKDYIDKLNIKTPTYNQKVRNLSGGNQQKVVLAKWLLTKAKVIILDEPTRGIDVGAKIEVYKLMNELVSLGKSIIMISSELPEILGMSDRILVMCRGEISAELNREEANQEKILYFAAGGGKYIA